MTKDISKYFLSCGLLGSGVATLYGTQQISLPLMSVVIWFLYMIISGGNPRVQASVLRIYSVFFAITLPGVIQFLYHREMLMLPVIQYLGLLIYWLVIWNHFQRQKLSVEYIFSIYLNCASWASALAILQQIAYYSKIEFMYDMRWLLIGVGNVDDSGYVLRSYSVFTEPSYFAAFLMPAIYFSILKFMKKSFIVGNFEGVFYMFALLSSFSTIGYIGLIACIVFALNFNVKNILIGILVILILAAFSLISPTIFSRYSSIVRLLDLGLVGDENLSVLANAINLEIAKRMLDDFPVFGVGLGGYREYSMGYLMDILSSNFQLTSRLGNVYDDLTLTDGGSMYFRLPSEIGLSGCAALLVLAVKVKSNHKQLRAVDLHIAKACLIFIMVFFIRSGQLIRFELVFFVALYFLAVGKLHFRFRVLCVDKNYVKAE